ncbi:YHYH protein [Salinispora arenicola]|uniref:YHYH protein n=1 Tax=Salinispora arenicola TaxID=168697 RepID=UPI001E53DB29|nr:YHYH protein [Salinispora arenicola]
MNFPHHPHEHPHHHPRIAGSLDRRALLKSGAFGLGAMFLAACSSSDSKSAGRYGNSSPTPSTSRPDATDRVDLTTGATEKSLDGFDAFSDSVRTFTTGDLWLVESNGLPAHQMMVGITSWQQQVPVAQAYSGANAWQFPVTPEMADSPISAKTGLFRGAIAIAANGIPIFNALNNRGDDAFLSGELDEFGGHCGRGDDYHYHTAPFHLEEAVGPRNPIAYALDGYAIYGSVEPDGSAVVDLDEFNGHTGTDGVYHYHGTTDYPYINGGLVGVVEVSDQVEPQPATPGFRGAGEPLPGATITGFDDLGDGSYVLEYTIDDKVGMVAYTVTDTTVAFKFTSPTGEVTSETYSR